jgi:hypothetical protein
MFPPANDLIALLGINLVLSAGCLRLLGWRRGSTPWAKVVTAAVFVLLWCPVGSARLPLVAYVRGISSDLSISLVAIACLGMYQRLRGLPLVAPRERMSVNLAFAAGALFLYPLALGWGDWDAYRLGWGSWGSGRRFWCCRWPAGPRVFGCCPPCWPWRCWPGWPARWSRPTCGIT